MKTILIVDDSAVMIMSLRQSLELGGFKVEAAKHGQEALTQIKNGLKPDLVLTDVNMPVMNGLDFIREVRPIMRFTPILILTTESDSSKRDEARKLGATGWLVKPVAAADLLATIKRILPGA